MAKLSIIVPVYRECPEIVQRCVDSVAAQSFKDWELLLIDDGSPSDLAMAYDDIAAKDSRIKIFHKSNGGVSSARNLGLDQAKGDRITFVDCDDEIFPGFFEKCMQYDEDVVSGMTEKVGKKPLLDEVPSPQVFSGQKDIFENVHQRSPRFTGPCSMIWKRKCVEQVRFDSNMRLGEDTLFSIQALLHADSVRTIDDLVYRYYAPTSYETKYCMSVKEAEIHVKTFFQVADRTPYMNQSFCYRRLSLFLSSCRNEWNSKPWRLSFSSVLKHYYNQYSSFFTKSQRWYYSCLFYFWPLYFFLKAAAKIKNMVTSIN